MEDDDLILESEIKKHLKRERSFHEEAFCAVIDCEPNDYELENKEDYFLFKHKEKYYKVITENQLFADLAFDCESFDCIERNVPPIAVSNVLMETFRYRHSCVFIEGKFWIEFLKICEQDIRRGLHAPLSKKALKKLAELTTVFVNDFNNIIRNLKEGDILDFDDVEEVILKFFNNLYIENEIEDAYSRIVWLILHFSDFDNIWPIYEETIQTVCDTLIEYGDELLCEFKDGTFGIAEVSIEEENEEEMIEQFCVFSVDDYEFNNSIFSEVIIEKYIEPKEINN